MSSEGSPIAKPLWRAALEIAGRAVLYALAIAALVLFAPGADHVFVYQGF